MRTKEKGANTGPRGHGMDEELAGVLTAISIVAKRLARKLLALQTRDAEIEEGGKPDEQDE